MAGAGAEAAEGPLTVPNALDVQPLVVQRAAAVQDLIGSKAIRRGLSLKVFDWGEVEPAGDMTFKQVAGLQQGLPEDLAKEMLKADTPEKRIQVGIEWCTMQSKELKAAGVPCLHYYTMGDAEIIRQIAERVF